MKKIICLLLMVTLLAFTGCDFIKIDNMEGINVYTTAYPIEYVTEYLYGENSTILSIYPDGINPDDYNLTDKQKQDYANGQLYVFNGLSKETDYIMDFFKKNKSIKIIDATANMEIDSRYEELWLDPASVLMIAQNVKTGLNEYINNGYLKSQVDTRYDALKVEISALDAKMQQMAENANHQTIIVANDMLNFMAEKYNFTVISLEPSKITEKTTAEAIELINNGTVKYIFCPEGEELTKEVLDVKNATNVSIEYLHTLKTISDEERRNKKDYVSIMYENIDCLKKELNR